MDVSQLEPMVDRRGGSQFLQILEQRVGQEQSVEGRALARWLMLRSPSAEEEFTRPGNNVND